MKKYKRWILILTALTVFVVVQVDSLRATSLIHAGKFTKLLNTSSTSSTTASPSSTVTPSPDRLREILDDLPDDDDSVIDVNGTKITLTGIPQIDYVWDPNLPRELNGFNLSTYPFLDSMPAEEDIGFDCEDKINGFYASIKYSCQLYHHCLYGVRSDFICANFTAFDQKTFICHFVSEVDCKNSHRYWNRNDDLYKATTAKTEVTSSTLVPLIDRGFYNRTRHSFLNGGSQSSSSQNNNNNNNSPSSSQNGEKPSSTNRDAPANSNNNNSNRHNNNNNNNNNNDDFNGGRPVRPHRRRPPYRRRPIDYYYYDDEYEDVYEDRRRQNRPRNRRPIYDDYDTRRPRPYYDDYDDYEYERRPLRHRNRSESKQSGGRHEDRRVSSVGGNLNENRRRPIYDDDRRRAGDRRQQQPQDERVRGGYSEERRFSDDDSRRDRYDDNRNYNNRRTTNNPSDESRRKPAEVIERKENTEETINDEKSVKPVGTSIFDRARPPPRISRPVPLSEKNKFAYKASEVRDETRGKHDDANVSYDYEDIAVSSSTTQAPKSSAATPQPSKAFSFQKLKPVSTTTKATTTTTTEPPVEEATEIEYVYEDEYYDQPTQKPILESSSIKPKDERSSFYSSRATVATSTTPSSTVASSPESFRLNRFTSRENVEKSTISPNGNGYNKKFASKQTVFEPVTHETPIKQLNNFQTAYINRNLENKHDLESLNESKPGLKSMVVFKRPFLPSRGGEPYKARGLQPVGIIAEQSKQSDETEEARHDGNRKQPEPVHKLTLEDLYNEEYDVDLNDALNPMLKPLTSSRNVQGYSSQQTTNVNDPQKSQTQRISSKADHFVVSKPTQVSSTTSQPEYYDDELEYTYADEVV